MYPAHLIRKPLVNGVRRSLAPLALSLPIAAVSMSAQAVLTPVGDEFFVNTTIPGNQSTDSSGQNVVVAPDGDFVVVWADESGADGDGYGVFARVFNADGTPQTGEIQVNTTTAGNQTHPAVAMDNTGNFVVAWEGSDADGYGVFARTFSAAGAPTSAEIPVNTTTAANQSEPSVAMDADGDFAVAWTSYGQDGSEYGIFARTFSSAAAPTSGEIAVNTTTADTQDAPSIAMDDSGDFAVAWESEGQDGSNYGVFVRTFSAAGAPTSGEVAVNTTTANSQANPSIAMDADGDFAVAWASYGQDGDYYGIFVRTFSAAGAPTSGEVQANEFTTDGQGRPSVSMQSDGDFVVAWNSYTQDGDDYGIWAREFNADGTPAGAEVQISQQAEGDQEDASISVNDDGDVVVAFRSGDDDSYDVGPPRVGGDDYDIIARQFTLNAVEAEPVPADNPMALLGLAAGAGLIGAGALRRRRSKR